MGINKISGTSGMKSRLYFLILFNLAAAQVNVHIESVPEGASIVIDSKSVGLTPQYNIKLKPGVHSIELTKKDYVPIKWKTVLQEAVKAEFTFRMKALYDVRFISKERGLRYKLDDGIEWIDNILQMVVVDLHSVFPDTNSLIGVGNTFRRYKNFHNTASLFFVINRCDSFKSGGRGSRRANTRSHNGSAGASPSQNVFSSIVRADR